MGNSKKEVGVMKKIYILHGWTYNTVKWKPFNDLLIKKGYKSKMFRVPGLTQPIKKPWTLDDYVRWLEGELPNKEVILIGHSNGGRISIAFALKHPRRIKHLILIDSAGIYHKELSLQIKRLMFTAAAKIGKRITKSPTLRKLLYKMARETDYEKADEILKQTMLNLIKVDLEPKLNKISMPTTIIWGKSDKIIPLKDGKLMHEAIKNSTFHVIEGGRHSPQFTHPDKVVDSIVKEL